MEKMQQIEDKLTEVLNELQSLKAALVNSNPPLPEYFNIKTAAKYLSMTESSLYKLTSSLSINFFQPNGKLILFSKSNLDEYVQKGRKKTKEEIELQAKSILTKIK